MRVVLSFRSAIMGMGLKDGRIRAAPRALGLRPAQQLVRQLLIG
jgi:hypothetical protein